MNKIERVTAGTVELMAEIGAAAREAARQLAQAGRAEKDEALTKAGTRLMDDAPEMAHRLGSGRRTDEYNRMMADKYASDMEMNERKQGALERWRQAQEEIKREELKQKGSKTSFTRIPKGDREAFTGYGDTIAGLEQTIAALEDENFDPGQQDLPMENTFKNWLTGTLGEGYAGDKDQDARHQWWQVYDRVYTLPVRNEMFGATLTQGEKDAWNAAHISREMTKQQIKERLEKQLETMKAARDREFKGIVTEGFYNPEAAAGYMGIPDYSAEEPVQERQSIQPLDQGQAPATQPQGGASAAC